jgi:hypothetical protein
MEDRIIRPEVRPRPQVEQRSVSSTFLNGAAQGAGTTVGVGVIVQGAHFVKKLKPKR